MGNAPCTLDMPIHSLNITERDDEMVLKVNSIDAPEAEHSPQAGSSNQIETTGKKVTGVYGEGIVKGFSMNMQVLADPLLKTVSPSLERGDILAHQAKSDLPPPKATPEASIRSCLHPQQKVQWKRLNYAPLLERLLDLFHLHNRLVNGIAQWPLAAEGVVLTEAVEALTFPLERARGSKKWPPL
ncbi:hypothetical protein Nepgr_012532 [Nepenthes gracilis]|uniref:Uncharacterized protein n=1 Tax=Nepenthes gracilis TaxID=150966 RepID=A0AAD3SHP3_NEPGR|nr:hypothetical protein Nepgr_012532 [Nepenthes gracilis]